jgi:hypothetical protein
MRPVVLSHQNKKVDCIPQLQRASQKFGGAVPSRGHIPDHHHWLDLALAAGR